MHPHRIEVLDRADDDDVVRAIADDFELELVPAANRLLHENLADRRLGQTPLHLPCEPSSIVGEAAAVAAEREGRPHDRRQGNVLELVDGGHDAGSRHLEPTAHDGFSELLTILRTPDHLDRRPDQLDADVLQHSGVRELDREVERGLSAQRGQKRIRTLALEHRGDALQIERLDVGAICEAGVGHDRGRIRVDDDRAVPVFAEHLQRLAARIIELAGLADDDRARADDADALEVSPRGHYSLSSSTQRSRIGQASCGPGPASGWNCTERAFRSGKSKPSTVPS